MICHTRRDGIAPEVSHIRPGTVDYTETPYNPRTQLTDRRCSMKTFRFPGLCAHCAAEGPQREWPISREEQSGNTKTTYSINVPVCASCHAQLSRRERILTLIGAVIGLVVL